MWTLTWHSARAALGVFLSLLRPQTWIVESHEGVSFFLGSVVHERTRPIRNTFTYPLRFAVVDLDSPPGWFTGSGQAGDHLTAVEARARCGTNGRVRLLTVPWSFGYAQNPISIYYCYENRNASTTTDDEALKLCLAEVTNTPWNERVIFSFDPSGQLVPKSVHVSPYMDMFGDWYISASDPKQVLTVRVSVVGPHLVNTYFEASLTAKLDTGAIRARSERAGLRRFLTHACTPHRIAIFIYYQALRIHLKGLRVFPQPGIEMIASKSVKVDSEVLSKPDREVSSKVDVKASSTAQRRSCSVDSKTCSFSTWRTSRSWPWDA